MDRILCTKQLTKFLITVLVGSAFLSPQASADTEKAKEFYNQGIKATQDGKFDVAIMAYEGAITQDPDYSDAYLNLGVIRYSMKEYGEALKMFKSACEKDDENVDAFANLGKVELKLKRYAEAE